MGNGHACKDSDSDEDIPGPRRARLPAEVQTHSRLLPLVSLGKGFLANWLWSLSTLESDAACCMSA